MKEQYLLLVFAFSFMAAYRLTISMNLRALLQMTLFAVPLASLIAQGEDGVTGWAYGCLAVAVLWWFADLYLIFRSARIAYNGQQRVRISKTKPAAPKATATTQPASRAMQKSANVQTSPSANAPARETVEMVSLKPSDIQYGPVIGLVENRPIYEWVSAQGRPGRAEYVGILGRGTTLEDNDLMLAPGLIYRWSNLTESRLEQPALESA